MRRRTSASELARVALVSLLFLAAPTAGDIGSCNQTATDLDATKFFAQKQDLDCTRCLDCSIVSKACELACGKPFAPSFPKGCYPVVHDGEVCLDALEIASCDAYASYMADLGATIPTECDFCPLGGADAGAGP
jgi:hypothetical protein